MRSSSFEVVSRCTIALLWHPCDCSLAALLGKLVLARIKKYGSIYFLEIHVHVYRAGSEWPPVHKVHVQEQLHKIRSRAMQKHTDKTLRYTYCEIYSKSSAHLYQV